MITVQCRNCNAQFHTDDSNAGKVARCPKCSSPITIPHPQAAPAPQVPVAQPHQTPPLVPQPQSVAGTHGGLAVGGFVCGLVSLPVAFIWCLWWLAVLIGITGIVLSAIAVATADKMGRKKNLATAGLICGIAGVVWAPIWFFVIAAAIWSELTSPWFW